MQFLHGYQHSGSTATDLGGVSTPAYTNDLLTLTPSGVVGYQGYHGYATPAYTTDLLDASNIGGNLSSYNEVPPAFGLEGHQSLEGIWSSLKSAAKKVGSAVVSAPGAAISTVKGVVKGDKKATSKLKKAATSTAKSTAKTVVKAEIKKATGMDIPDKITPESLAKTAAQADTSKLIQKGSKVLRTQPKNNAQSSSPPPPPAAPVEESSNTGLIIGGVALLAAVGGGIWYFKAKGKSGARKNPYTAKAGTRRNRKH